MATRSSIFREALQVSRERVAELDETDLDALMWDLLRSHAYRTRADVSKVVVNTQGKAKDDGCDACSPRPPSDDEWFGAVDTCWQLKAGTAGRPAALKGEVTKRIPQETLKAGSRFVVIASNSTNGKKGEDDRLAILHAEATAAGLPTQNIQVIGSERLTSWCNQHPAVAARFAGRPEGLCLLEDWARIEPHRAAWQTTPMLDSELARLRQELDFSGEKLVHMHIEGHPGVGKTRFALELCQGAPWKSAVVYVRNASDLRLTELIDGATADSGVRLVVVADEVQPGQLNTLRDSLDRGNGRVRLITIGHCSTPNPRRIPAIKLKPVDRQAMSRVIGGWHPTMPREHVEFVTRFADGYVRLARLASDAIARDPALDVRGLLDLQHIRAFLDSMLQGGNRRALYVVAVLRNVGWTDDLHAEGKAVAEHLGQDWNEVRASVEDFQQRLGIVPRGGRYRYISPSPLAIYLAVEAWTAYPDMLKTLPDKLPTEGAKAAYDERLQEIASNPYARKFAREELGFFFRLADFVDPWGARRWSALSTADPGFATRNLLKALSEATLEDRLSIRDRARRELVNSLVRLAWNRATFRSASMSLALLGEAENETWANNASHEFSARFQVFLGGTSVPYLERLPVLDELVAMTRPVLTSLAIKALSRVGNSHQVRWGSSPTSDAVPEPEWQPATVGDLIDCIEQAAVRLTAIARDGREELANELVAAARELSMLLREDGVRGCIAGVFEAIRESYPAAREPLRRVIADIIYSERKYWKQLSDADLATLDALHRRFEDSSLPARLRQRVGPGRWEKDEAQNEFEDIAQEVVRDRDSLAREWPWLTSGEAGDGWKFGAALAIVDVDSTLDEVLPELPGRGPDLRVLCGYLAKRREQRGAEWFDAWVTRTVASRPDDMALLFEASWRCGMTIATARLIAKAVREGKAGGQFTHQLENGPWPLTLPLESLDDMLDALASSGHRRVAIAILDQRLRASPEQLERLESVALELATSSDVIRSGAAMTDFHWKEVAVRLVPRHASAIAAAIFREQADRSRETWFAEYSTAKEVLYQCVAREPAGAWRALAPHLASIGEGLHFGIGFPLGLLDQMPVEEIGQWVAEKPEERAAVVSRLVSKSLISDDTLMARVLGRFGDQEAIASSFYSAYVSGSWVGSASGHWAQLATDLERVVRTTKLPKLRQWAEEAARGLRQREERDAQREEEEALRDR